METNMTTRDGDFLRQRGGATGTPMLENASLRDRLHKALADLERAEAELALTRTELDVARDQLRTMRLSAAWQITAPIRRLKRRVTRGDAW
jgi:chromosome segregation ATPase